MAAFLGGYHLFNHLILYLEHNAERDEEFTH